jgi:UDP-N-acetylglucosamine--N-acetylmuramyl-(pentapeptide) pyrophosphoryl-undecaprenol N-acetylglucosamine transferase
VNLFFAGGGTGGHLYPGLAIARALVALRPGVRPYFIGAKRGIERDVLPQAEFPYSLFDLHPIYRPRVWLNYKTLVGAARSWREMSALGRDQQPRVVIGTGGYASGLALAWAWTKGVPIVQHIGDSHPGATARLFTRISREAYLGFPEAESWLPHSGCVFRDTGNPIDPPPDIRPDTAAAKARWGFPASARVLLVFGGSQGARALNQAVAGWLEHGLPSQLCVIWATGKAQYDSFKQYDRADVRVVPYLSPIAEAYAASDLAFVRGGMMGTSELSAWGVPMLICPLPTAAQDHQTSNALALEKAGAAVHLAQRNLTSERLDATVRMLLDDPARLATLATAARTRARPNAAAEIAAHIAKLLD